MIAFCKSICRVSFVTQVLANFENWVRHVVLQAPHCAKGLVPWAMAMDCQDVPVVLIPLTHNGLNQLSTRLILQFKPCFYPPSASGCIFLWNLVQPELRILSGSYEDIRSL